MAQPTTKQTQPEENREESNKSRQEFPSKGEGLENRKPSLVTPRQTASSQGIDEDRDLTDIESDVDEDDAEGNQVGNLNKPYGETQRRMENPAKESSV